jgi:hypothetical protein
MADLRIDLAAEFKGKKAFTEADKSVSGLDKAVGKLGKQIASVFAAQKVLAFGKASVKAFAEDQASAARLAKTVDNLGLSFANPAIDQFIKKLEMQSGIVDETLRPAFQALLTTTGDVSKSMSLLTSAIDISRGSGVDLATVTQDLANGYVGITRGLKKYNLGLSQAQLKSKSFEEIMGLLNKQFNGASATYLDTYAGKMDTLNVAADNAKEIIGKGLVDALTGLAGQNTNVQDIATAMQGAADATANFTRGVGLLIGEIKKIPGLDTLAKLFELSVKYSPAGLISKLGTPKTAPTGGYGVNTGTVADYKRQQDEKAAAKAKAAADAKAAALAKASVKAQQQLTAEQKKQAALKKDAGIFDMQQIELIAALKGKLSEDDQNRVKLQLALLDNNVAEADRLSKLILMSQDETGNLYKYFLSIGDMTIKNPFAFLDTWLAEFQKKLAATLAMTNTATATTTTSGQATFSTAIAALGVKAGYGADIPQTGTPSTIASTTLANGSYGIQTGSSNWVDTSAATGKNTNVQVVVNGNVVTEQDLIDAIQRGLQTNSLSGSPSAIGRIAGMFG